MSVAGWLRQLLKKQKMTSPGEAYDLWAIGYDDQPGNLMLDLDEALFSALLKETLLTGKTMVDIGCGTGRNWEKMMNQNPKRLTGYDVSKGMLDKLKEKFPAAETFLLKDNQLEGLENNSCDMVVSTLTVAHIEKIEMAFKEWNRVLKPGGEVIITDYHPDALEKGGKRTFSHNGKTVAIKNYIHATEKIRQLWEQLGLKEMRFIERRIDDSVKNYYEQQNALGLFEKFRGVPIIYGIYLKKTDGFV